ncbi:MAG: hypothetical protein PVF73_13520, partial [Bacteroidales bacterium]|jgi:hypothetical protein
LVFLEFLVDGISDLYYYKNDSKNCYFLDKDGYDMVELATEGEILLKDGNGKDRITYDERYKGALKYYFSDCPEIYSDIDYASFDHGSFIKISRKYHEKVCPGEDCIVYTRNTKMKVFFGPKLGLDYSMVGLETSSDYARDLSVRYGIQFRFVPSIVFYRWNFIIGFGYTSVSYDDYLANNIIEDPYYPDIDDVWHIYLKHQTFFIPVKIQYTFPFNNIHAGIFAGYNNIFVINPDYMVERSYAGNFYHPMDVKYPNYLSGFMAGLIFNYEFENEIRVFIETEYEFRKRVFDQVYFTDHYLYLHSFAVNFGMDFPILH